MSLTQQSGPSKTKSINPLLCRSRFIRSLFVSTSHKHSRITHPGSVKDFGCMSQVAPMSGHSYSPYAIHLKPDHVGISATELGSCSGRAGVRGDIVIRKFCNNPPPSAGRVRTIFFCWISRPWRTRGSRSALNWTRLWATLKFRMLMVRVWMIRSHWNDAGLMYFWAWVRLQNWKGKLRTTWWYGQGRSGFEGLPTVLLTAYLNRNRIRDVRGPHVHLHQSAIGLLGSQFGYKNRQGSEV